MSELEHVKIFNERLSKFKDIKIPFGKYKNSNIVEYKEYLSVWSPTKALDDSDYWIWFFTNVENKSTDIINIKRFMCLSAYILSTYHNVEVGFLRKYGNAFMKEYGMDYKDKI